MRATECRVFPVGRQATKPGREKTSGTQRTADIPKQVKNNKLGYPVAVIKEHFLVSLVPVSETSELPFKEAMKW